MLQSWSGIFAKRPKYRGDGRKLVFSLKNVVTPGTKGETWRRCVHSRGRLETIGETACRGADAAVGSHFRWIWGAGTAVHARTDDEATARAVSTALAASGRQQRHRSGPRHDPCTGRSSRHRHAPRRSATPGIGESARPVASSASFANETDRTIACRCYQRPRPASSDMSSALRVPIAPRTFYVAQVTTQLKHKNCQHLEPLVHGAQTLCNPADPHGYSFSWRRYVTHPF